MEEPDFSYMSKTYKELLERARRYIKEKDFHSARSVADCLIGRGQLFYGYEIYQDIVLSAGRPVLPR